MISYEPPKQEAFGVGDYIDGIGTVLDPDDEEMVAFMEGIGTKNDAWKVGRKVTAIEPETAFCIAWALKERLNAATKKGSTLRKLMDEKYRELYEADGETGHDVHVMGQKVGRYTFPTAKGTPERTVTKAMAYDHDAILADDNEDFAEWLKAYVRLHIGELAERYVTETGDILDGVSVITETEPAKPSVISSEGNPYGISYDRITEALPELRQTIRGLIGTE